MTKENLRQYRHLKLERDRLLGALQELEATMTAPKSQRPTITPTGPSKGGSATEALVVKHAELLDRYSAKLTELADALLAIEKAIEGLEPRERTLLRLHYIEGLTWEEVCVEMAYSWRQVHRIHAKALEELRNV